MTLLLWWAAFALLTFVLLNVRIDLTAPADRWWLEPAELGAASEPAAPAPRSGLRPAAQTGAAVLALAIALEASTAVAAPPAPEPGGILFDAHAAAGPLNPGISYEALAPVPQTWSLAAYSDGWFS